MHERSEGIPFRPRAKAGEEGERDGFEEVGDYWVEEQGCRGADFGVGVDEKEEGFVDVGAEFGGAVGGGDPGR